MKTIYYYILRHNMNHVKWLNYTIIVYLFVRYSSIRHWFYMEYRYSKIESQDKWRVEYAIFRDTLNSISDVVAETIFYINQINEQC